MFNPRSTGASQVRPRRRLRAALARPRRWAAAAAATVAMVLAAAVGVIGPASPAHADEPGLFCTVTSSGTISAPSPVRFGQFITVQWSTETPYCSAPLVYMVGPGFGPGETVGLSGSRQIRAVTAGSTMTWSLHILDMETDSQTPAQLASRTITVL